METPENQFQRRAIAGHRHFILADLQQPDSWALPGAVILAEDENGQRRYGPARTISTAQLKAWAKSQRLPFRIVEKFPVVRGDVCSSLAA